MFSKEFSGIVWYKVYTKHDITKTFERKKIQNKRKNTCRQNIWLFQKTPNTQTKHIVDASK